MKKIHVSETHMIAALEGYLKAMAMIDDDDVILDIKRNRNNEYDIILENTNE